LTEKWVNEEILDNGRRDTFPLPSDIKPGMYIFRTDLVALHGNTYGGGLPKKGTGAGPQFYTHCFNVKILGDGTASPEGVKFPGGYKREDPGLTFSLRNKAAFNNYVSIFNTRGSKNTDKYSY
jgi:cellulase